MEDPLSSLHDRPHRYLLESDSSDEEGQGLYGGIGPESASGPSTKPKIRTTSSDTVVITINGDEGRWATATEILVGLGQAGRFLSRKFGLKGTPDVEVKMGSVVVGSGWTLGTRLVLALDDQQVHQDQLHDLATVLLRKAPDGATWLVVSTYLPSLYIPDRPLELYAAPIRYLAIKDGHVASRSVRGAESITSPNYVTGAAAALLTMLARQSTSAASLVLLPLPMSSIPNTDLVNALSDLSSANTVKSPFTIPSRGAVWSEDDDEPFAQVGMGQGKNRDRTRAGDLVKREVDGMYM